MAALNNNIPSPNRKNFFWKKQDSVRNQNELEENSIEKHMIAIRERIKNWMMKRFQKDIKDNVSLIDDEYKK